MNNDFNKIENKGEYFYTLIVLLFVSFFTLVVSILSVSTALVKADFDVPHEINIIVYIKFIIFLLICTLLLLYSTVKSLNNKVNYYAYNYTYFQKNNSDNINLDLNKSFSINKVSLTIIFLSCIGLEVIYIYIILQTDVSLLIQYFNQSEVEYVYFIAIFINLFFYYLIIRNLFLTFKEIDSYNEVYLHNINGEMSVTKKKN